MSAVLAELADGLRRNYYEPKRRRDRAPTTREKEGARRALAALDAAKRASDPKIAQEIVSRHLARYTANRPLPPLILHFLDEHWRSFLVRVYISEGENGSNWRNALDATEKLVWSVRRKRSAKSRHRLFALLPELFEWVHSALELQQVQTSDEDAFFAELSQLHAATLHTERPTAIVHPAKKHEIPKKPSAHAKRVDNNRGAAAASAETPRREQAESTEPSRKREALNIENTRKEERAPLQTPAKRASTAESTDSDPLSGMRIGSRVEFSHGRDSKRVLRVKWISRLGNVFHLQDQNTNDELCVTATRLIRHLREHSACILN